jgi:hypothetical protein
VGSCGPRPPLDQIEVADIASGSVLASHLLTGAAQNALAVAVDALLGQVNLVTPSAVMTYDAATLDPVGSLPLPAGLVADESSGAVVGANGTLWLAVRRGSQAELLGLDERSGHVRADVALAGVAATDGPLYDVVDRSLLLLERASDGAATLAEFAVSSGGLQRQLPLAMGTRLGPPDTTADAVYLLAADGTTPRLDLPGAAGGAGATTVPALFGARALGWGDSGQQQYVADAAGFRMLDAQSGATIAALPVAVESPSDQPLIAVSANGTPLLALFAEHGTLLVIQPVPAGGGLTAGTAVLLARASLAKLAPHVIADTSAQDPPFLTADMFTPAVGARAQVPFMIDDPDVGWKSAAPGTTAVAVASAAGGAYDVTFTATWTYHAFTQRHVTVVRVAPDGGVRLVSDTGDAEP